MLAYRHTTIPIAEPRVTRPSLRELPREATPALLSEPTPPWKQETLQRLEAIYALESGWDSYDAQPVALSRVFQAYSLLRFVMSDATPVPALVPTANGSIQIEWHTLGVNIEALLVSDADIEVWFEDLRGEVPSFEGIQSYDIAPFREAVRLLDSRALLEGEHV